ncbi:MAG: thiamine-phosphate kinase [Candidatus Omnitrophica bacterium]|nr:thiamine-phosphate kinase [Candidatus Omnitrophota bacterium]MBU1090801.1 thiamine-phosphate kinase [Candidatus Omnitrophota bacterium]
MQVHHIGEFGLIKRFQKLLKTDRSVVEGSGDDCAVLKLDRFRYQLFACDMIAEDSDFKLNDDPYLIGRKALAVSVSDIAACGGLPKHCIISIGMPKTTPVKFIDRVFRGSLNLARKYSINIVGGDISSAPKLIIDTCLLGVVEKSHLVLRGGAKVGDIIFVSGELGGSRLGKHLKFTPRVKEARFLVENFKVNSMIDISDGLTQDLSHVLGQSKKGAIIFEQLIPASRHARNLKDVLGSGEDYELLFTLSRKEAKRLVKRNWTVFKPIGEIVDKNNGFRFIDKKNRETNLEPEGFRHF